MRFSLCEVCKRPLQGGELCPDCLLKRQEMQRYSSEKQNVGPAQLSELFDVPQGIIEKWVKKGELHCMMKCRNCGQFIRIGTLCADCKGELRSAFREDINRW